MMGAIFKRNRDQDGLVGFLRKQNRSLRLRTCIDRTQVDAGGDKVKLVRCTR